MRGYRSAINVTIKSASGRDWSDDLHLSLLVRQFEIQYPRKQSVALPWDLTMVLVFLCHKSYELLADAVRRYLVLKTVLSLWHLGVGGASSLHSCSMSHTRESRRRLRVCAFTWYRFFGQGRRDPES